MVKLIQTTKNGINDLLCLKKKKYLWIEVKREGKKADPLQEYRHKELSKHGAKVITVTSKKEVIDYLYLDFIRWRA